MKIAFALLLTASAGVVQQGPLEKHKELPDGPGKKAIEKVCYTACHGPENVLKKRRTKDAWDKVLDDMSIKGAKATDEEFDLVLTYLSRYYAQINVNKATADEIREVLDITADQA